MIEFFVFVVLILLAMIWIRLGSILGSVRSMNASFQGFNQQCERLGTKLDGGGMVNYYLEDIHERIRDNFMTWKERKHAADSEP